jgi:hypothetical protein
MSDKPDLFSQEYQKEQSEKYKYKHIHTGEYCTYEAYVAEFLVLRRAEKLKLDKPSYKFWTKGDPNHWLWMKQLNAARALAKKYSEEAVLSAIKSADFNKYLLIGLQNGRGWKINPIVEPIIDKHHKAILAKKASESTEYSEVKDNPVRRSSVHTTKKSIMNSLRNKNG